jgi:hypothetical protein
MWPVQRLLFSMHMRIHLHIQSIMLTVWLLNGRAGICWHRSQIQIEQLPIPIGVQQLMCLSRQHCKHAATPDQHRLNGAKHHLCLCSCSPASTPTATV